ncbi:MAG: hypothetical protein H0Z33_05190 [Bacillaceae bacterium]|nr:hypothetical protein [Bacillaceae bacterium]
MKRISTAFKYTNLNKGLDVVMTEKYPNRRLIKISLIVTGLTLALTVGVILLFTNSQQNVKTTASASNNVIHSENSVAKKDARPKESSLIRQLNPVYDITAELQPTLYQIKGEMEVTFDNPGTDEIMFYLYDYPGNRMEIETIMAGAGKLSFSREERVVTIQNPYRSRKRITVHLSFRSSVPQAGTRFGYKDGVWLLTHWYPMLGVQSTDGDWYVPKPPASIGGDPFYYQHADYKVRLTSPQDLKWVTTGVHKHDEKTGDGKNRHDWEAENVLNFVLAGSSRFMIDHIDAGDTKVTVALINRENRQKILDMVRQAFTTFADRYGPLRYPHVGVVETGPGTVFAMEYSNIAFYSVDMHRHNQVEHWLPHEIAHLWWYNSVSTLEPVYGWIDEGLAEASVVDYLEEVYGEQTAQRKWTDFERNWQLLRRQHPEGYLGKGLYEFGDYFEFRRTWYTKSALLFRHLKKEIGEEKYQQFLKLLNGDYVHTIIGPEQLDRALGQVVNGETRYFTLNLNRPHRNGFAAPVIHPYLRVIVGGEILKPEVQARMIKGVAYLPLRETAEKLGMKVTWDPQTDKVAVVHGEMTTEIKPPIEIENRSLVPLSFFIQDLGMHPLLHEEEKTVIFP